MPTISPQGGVFLPTQPTFVPQAQDLFQPFERARRTGIAQERNELMERQIEGVEQQRAAVNAQAEKKAEMDALQQEIENAGKSFEALNKAGLHEEALEFLPALTNGEITQEEVGKLQRLDRERKGEISNMLQKVNDYLNKNPDTAPEEKEAVIGAAKRRLKGMVGGTGVPVEQGAEAQTAFQPSGELVPEPEIGIQPSGGPTTIDQAIQSGDIQPASEASIQDQITDLRNLKLGLESLTPRTTINKSKIEAQKNRIDGEITDLNKQLTRERADAKARAKATAKAAEGDKLDAVQNVKSMQIRNENTGAVENATVQTKKDGTERIITSSGQIVETTAGGSLEDIGFSAIGPGFESQLKKEGNLAAVSFDGIQKDGKQSFGKVQTLRVMDRLLDRIETNRLANAKQAVRSWVNAFGLSDKVDVDKLAASEAFSAFANQLALQSRNLGDGALLAGQMSERDVQFLKDMNPQLIRSKAGNRTLIAIRMKMAQISVDKAKFATEFKKQNKGRFDQGEFETAWRQEASTRSIFGIPEGSQLVPGKHHNGLPVYQSPEGKLFAPDI